ncbi:MAG: glycosyltransferase 87 family protein [Desulfobacterales bacterium]|jgi:hypothetical protein
MKPPDYRVKQSFDSRAIFSVIVGLAGLSAAVYGCNFKIFDLVPLFSGLHRIQLYIIMFLILSVLYFIAVFLVIKFMPRAEPSWKLTGVIICFAIVFRLCLVPSDPSVLSRDMYRYIWDGRVQQDGINPYRYPPQADELKHLREHQIYPKINRKDYPTLYPAGAQIFFRLFYALVGSDVSAYKGIMVFFDVVTLLVLTALLRAYDFNVSRVIIYAWNPLVIFEIAYSGHLEGLTVFLMTAALYLYTIHKKIAATIMLAFSAAVKLYPALLLSAFLNRGVRIKGITTFSATIICLYLPFLNAGDKISGFLPVYLKNPYESFNLGLKNLLMRWIPGLDYYLLSLVFLITLTIAGLVVFIKEKEDIDVLRYAFILVGLLMVLMPASLHPWYVVLIVPFLAIYPNPAWLFFTSTVTLSYLKYTSPQGIMPTWILLIEYLPLFSLLAAGWILKYRFKGSRLVVE